MKTIIEKIIKLRNPAFRFHPDLNNTAIIQFIWIQGWSLLRAMRLIIWLRNPKGATFGKGVTLFNLSRMHWGKFLKLGKHVHISALGKGGVSIGDNVGIGAFSNIVVSTTLDNPGEYIKIGSYVGIGEYAYLGGAGGLEIGDHCIAGQYLSCHPENHVYEDLSTPIRLQNVTRKGIKIGNNCWMGSKVTILDGVELGEGCIVAAGAVVNKSFPPFSIIGGVPAKLLKTRNNNDENNTGYHIFRKSI